MKSIDEILEAIKKHPKLVLVDDYEIVAENEDTHLISPIKERAEIKRQNQWLSLRISHRKHRGASVLTGFDQSKINWLVESAFSSADQSSADPWFRFPMWKKAAGDLISAPNLISEEEYWKDWEGPNPFFEEVMRKNTKTTTILRKTEKFSKTKEISEVEQELYFYPELARSFHSAKQSKKILSYADIIENKKRVFQFLRAKNKAKEMKNKAGLPVIFSPRIISELLYKIAPLFSAGTKRDFQLIRPEFSKAITLIDDSTYEGFDLEGTCGQKTVLIEKGAERSLLYDTYLGTQENRLSTSNFVRKKSGGFPKVEATRLFIQPGESSIHEMIRGKREFLYLEAIDSMEQRGERKSEWEWEICLSGWHNGGAAAAEPVKGISIQISLINFFNEASQVSSDFELFKINNQEVGSPSILFDEMP